MQSTVISARPLEYAIKDFLRRNDIAGLDELLSTQLAPDLADVLDRLPARDQEKVFKQLPAALGAETLVETDGETKRTLLNSLSREELSAIGQHLPMDNAARIVDSVPIEGQRLLAELD